MLIVRSLLFNVAFYANLILWLIILIPGFLVPRRVFIELVKVWGRTSLWLLRVIAGTKVEITGLEKIPPGGALVAAKHQSFLGNLRPGDALRRPDLHPQARADVDPLLRLVSGEGALRARRPQGGIAGAGADDGAGKGRGPARAPDHHLSRRHAPGAGRAAGLQVRRGASLPESRLPLHSGRHEFGPVLAAPPVHPPSRNDPRSRSSSPSRRAFRARSSSSCCRSGSRNPPTGCWTRAGRSSASAPPPLRRRRCRRREGDLTSWPGSSRPSRQGKARRATNRDHRHEAGDDESARSPRCAKNHANPSAAKLSAT